MKKIKINKKDLDAELIRASVDGNTEKVNIALESGANIRAKNDLALAYACIFNHLEIVKIMIEKYEKSTLISNEMLAWAASSNSLETVMFLIEYGANPQSENNMALITAASNGHTQIVKYLIEKGADIHAQDNRAFREAVFDNNNLQIAMLLAPDTMEEEKLNMLFDTILRKNSIEIAQYLILEKGYPINKMIERASGFINNPIGEWCENYMKINPVYQELKKKLKKESKKEQHSIKNKI